jgi:hypothetical protein
MLDVDRAERAHKSASEPEFEYLQMLLSVAEVIRNYSNTVLPDFAPGQSDLATPTLLDQSDGQAVLQPSRDEIRPVRQSRLTAAQRQAVVELYATEPRLQVISRQVGISWDSVGRILDDAGLRAMPGRRW